MTTLKVGKRLQTATEHPRVWPFPTFRGQPYCPPEPLKAPKASKKPPVWKTAPPALL